MALGQGIWAKGIIITGKSSTEAAGANIVEHANNLPGNGRAELRQPGNPLFHMDPLWSRSSREVLIRTNFFVHHGHPHRGRIVLIGKRAAAQVRGCCMS